MPRRMEPTRDLTDKKVTKTGQESRKPSFTEMQYRTRENSSERQYRGNMSGAAQVHTPRSKESVYRDRRFDLGQERWQEKRRDGGVMSQSRPKMREAEMKCKVNLSRSRSLARELTALRISGQSSESPRHGLQRQGNEVKSRPNEKKSNTRKLGQLKGGGGEEESSDLLRLRCNIKAEQLKTMEKMSNDYISRREYTNQMHGKPDYPTLHRERDEESKKLDVVRDELEYLNNSYKNAVRRELNLS